MTDLRETAARARDGNERAFESLFVDALPRLRAFIRMHAGGLVTTKESVSDIAQSVCREVLADIDGFDFRGEEAFRGYLFRHAMHKILNRQRFYRQARRDAAREQAFGSEIAVRELVSHYATIATPSRHAAAREELARLEAVIRELPEKQRQAIALSRIVGLSYGEIAAQMDCSESAVRGLVARGLARLSMSFGIDGQR